MTVIPADTPSAELALVRNLAHILDQAFTIPGTKARFGLDAILGLIPGIGDLASSAIGGYILLVASRLGVPASVQWRMLLNLAIDAAVGIVPFAGDLLDVAFRANAKNARLLTEALAEPAKARRSSWWVLATVGVGFLAITAAGVFGTVMFIRWVVG